MTVLTQRVLPSWAPYARQKFMLWKLTLLSEQYSYNYSGCFTEEMLERKPQIDLGDTVPRQRAEDLPRHFSNYHKHQ